MTTILRRFTFRRGSAAAWTAVDPVLLEGEPGLETDTGFLKFGDGVTAWTALDYFAGVVEWGGITGTLSDQADLQAALTARILATEKGAAGGVATLDGGGKVPVAQLPALAVTDVFVVNSQAAQLALTAEEGDVAVRTDLSKSFIHNGGSAGTMADWQEMLTPTDLVLSVNGMTGAVTISTITGNAGTATALANSRNFSIAGGGITAAAVGFNGTAAVVLNASIDAGAVVNAHVGAGAAIAFSKMAALTASRALVSDGAGVVSASATTATEIGYLSGVTSAVQTQLGTKAPTASPTFTGTAVVDGMRNAGTITARFENTGAANAAGVTGPGLEIIGNAAGEAFISAYNRTAAAYIALSIRASTVKFPTGAVSFGGVGTTASAANAFLDSGAGNNLLRSTSSRRYKTDIHPLPPEAADRILDLRPVRYRSLGEYDNPEWSFYGLIAEEVAQVDPRLVQWGYWPEDYDGSDPKTLRGGAKLRPDGVQYERLVVPMLDIIRRQRDSIDDLRERLAALEALTAHLKPKK